jgi:hypothetical protein
MGTNPAELMHPGESTDGRVVLDNDVSGQRGCVGQDDVIAQDTIMSDMTIDHEEIMIPNQGAAPALDGSAVHRDVFSEYVAVPDNQFGMFSFVFEILRWKTDGGIRKKLATVADLCATLDHNMGVYPTPLPH